MVFKLEKLRKWPRGRLPRPHFSVTFPADPPFLSILCPRARLHVGAARELLRMAALQIFLPLLKVDLDQRLVHGVVTAEQPDRSGEICDYESTKPYFEAWSRNASDVTRGKSLGAVRAMHGNVAAGKLTDIAFDDDNKRISVAAKIVDDDEWRKVQEGVYTSPPELDRTIDSHEEPRILTIDLAVVTYRRCASHLWVLPNFPF